MAMTKLEGQRPFMESIEHSLELERQLQLESETPPLSPTNKAMHPPSYDPHILASLVSSLTAERDALVSALEASTEREEQLRNELHRHLERVATQDEQIELLQRKNEEAEESVMLLRSKVEDSRRALMRLQTESRRGHGSGNMSIDLSRASGFSFGGPPSAKRASFTPLAGSPSARNHQRRPSNIADSTLVALQTSRSILAVGSEPTDESLSILSVPTNHEEYAGSFPHSPGSPNIHTDADALQKEVKSLQRVLANMQADLAEVNEAREASEACVKALRNFITDNNIGSPITSIPPSSSAADSEGPIAGVGTARWTFGLWRSSEPARESSGSASNTITSPPSLNAASSEPLSRKLGSFFGSRQPNPAFGTSPGRSIQEHSAHGSTSTSSYAE